MTDSKDTNDQAAAEEPARIPRRKKKQRRIWHSPWFLPGVVAALGVAAVGASWLFGKGWAERGQIGDSFAPLTSMLTVAVLILTVSSVQIQRRELQLQRKELRLQREEMRRQRKALKQQAASQEEQAKAQRDLIKATEANRKVLNGQMYAQRAQTQASLLLARTTLAGIQYARETRVKDENRGVATMDATRRMAEAREREAQVSSGLEDLANRIEGMLEPMPPTRSGRRG